MANPRSLAVSMFGWAVDKYGDMFTVVKESLPKAGIKMTFRTYMSMVFFIAALSYASSFAMLIFALRIVELSLMMTIAYLVFIPFTIAISCVIMFIFYPYNKMSERKKSIETNLPFVLTHMSAIAESGVPPYVVFRLIAEFEEYGEVSTEMKKIVRNIDTFGVNPLKSVKEVAERTPSDKLKQILLGFVTTTESGGDVKVYLKNAGQSALFDWRIKREKFLQQLSAYAEFYTGILIAAPLFIVALFAVMGMIQSNVAGYDIMFLMQMSVYVLIPALNGGFLLFLTGTEVEM